MSSSLADVAKIAGVSLATASRVVSGSDYPVSQSTRTRVLNAAKQLGYRPNALARALATQNNKIIGLMIGSVTDPYFAEISRGVEDFTRPHGYLTIVCNTDRNLSVEMAYLKLLGEYQGGGIIFAGGMFTNTQQARELSQAVHEAWEQGVYMISIGERTFDNTPAITVDHRAGLYDLTGYMINLGHRRIAFVEGPRHFTTSDARLQGYLDAMKDSGLEPLTYPGSFDYQDGRASALRILNDGLPDAIVTFNDDSAVGVLMTLRQAGVNVPEDVSLAGVDNIRYAEVLDLTTVEVPRYELGAMAARSLLNWEESPPPPKVVLPHRVVPRGTTARRNK